MGCHTEGMKTFEDQMRPVIAQNRNPSYDKAQASRLYVEKSRMDSLVREDITRYRRAIEDAGGVFGGSEPIQRLVKQFEGPLDAAHAAAEVGLKTDDFLKEIRGNSTLQNAGLLVLDVEKGTVKRDAWESQFGRIVSTVSFDRLTNTTRYFNQNNREGDSLLPLLEVPEFPESHRAIPQRQSLLPLLEVPEPGVVRPQYKSKGEPKYPEVAAKAGKEGQVILQAIIDENGIPRDIVAITNIGFGFEEASIAALQQTTFHPATKGGNPISLQVEIPYSFTLKTRSNSVYADMVLIPAGEFRMGSNDNDAEDDEKPMHTVYVNAFYIHKYEVTNTQYKKFVDVNPQWQKDRIPQKYHDGDYLKHWNGNDYPHGKGNHPVIYVSWYAAMAYAQWSGKRLPTEAEWEKAARGDLVLKKYTWGGSLDSDKANYGESVGGTTAVGTYPANGYGLYDMTGNVWEWCLDEYNADFYSVSPRHNPFAGGTVDSILSDFTTVKNVRVLRGGSWISNAKFVRVSDRTRFTPQITNNARGFRCVKPVIP